MNPPELVTCPPGAAGALTIEATWGDRQANVAQRAISARELDHIRKKTRFVRYLISCQVPGKKGHEQPLVVPQFKHL